MESERSGIYVYRGRQQQHQSGSSSGSSTRWNPTSEQLRILRDLYYTSGIRSPTADQIQRISWKLSRYGQIEGKNVFYWFQNHKARERQKNRLMTDLNVHGSPTFEVGNSVSSRDFASKRMETRYCCDEPSSHGKFLCSNTGTKEPQANSGSGSFPVLVYKEGPAWDKYFSKEESYVLSREKSQDLDSWVGRRLTMEDCLMGGDGESGVSDENGIRSVETLELFPVHHEDWSPKSSNSSLVHHEGWIPKSCNSSLPENSVGAGDRGRDLRLDLCLNPHK